MIQNLVKDSLMEDTGIKKKLMIVLAGFIILYFALWDI